MNDPKDRASTRLTERLRTITQKVEEFQATYKLSMPILGKSVTGIGEVASTLTTLANKAQAIYIESGAALGHMLETDLDELMDSVEGAAKLVTHIDVFLQNNPHMLAYVINSVNRGIIREAAKNLDDGALVKWIDEFEVILNERDEANRIKGDG